MDINYDFDISFDANKYALLIDEMEPNARVSKPILFETILS
jgi:hypothetical protein